MDASGAKRWLFLFRWGGKLKEMGLGGAGSVSLRVMYRGLEYAMRCFAASSKAALDTLADLKAANIGGR